LFEGIYFSPWHNPAAIWLVGLFFLGVLARARRDGAPRGHSWVWRYSVFFTLAIAIDALCSGGWSPTAGTAVATPIAIFFVILGDFRFFLLLERHAPRASAPLVWGKAALWAFAIPVGSTMARHIWPAFFENQRITFLTYEAAFVVLALVIRFVVIPRRFEDAPDPVRRWVERVAVFEIVQYALWATADVVILSGIDAGFALRLVPNLMYYGFFVPFVWVTAPREAI
jgi:hypothetical protein